MLCSGEIRSIDLRMLGRGLGTEMFGAAGIDDASDGGRLCAPKEWPIVTAASDD
eukprot:COSAG02_NODE_35437_length_468_cov_1.035230_1_plen_53_part_10